MSDRFRIHKTGLPILPWAMDYPHGFSDGSIGEMCSSFINAVEAFVKASERQCPMCLKGAVVDTDWGWRCESCGTYDVAAGCVTPR